MGNVFCRIGSRLIAVIAFAVVVTLAFLSEAVEMLRSENQRWKQVALREHHEKVRELRREKMRIVGG